jgi:hypothetical protein
LRVLSPLSQATVLDVSECCQDFSRSHQELEAKNCRCDADYRCSAIHCLINSLAVVVVAVFMIVYDRLPHSRLDVKRLAVLVVTQLRSLPMAALIQTPEVVRRDRAEVEPELSPLARHALV